MPALRRRNKLVVPQHPSDPAPGQGSSQQGGAFASFVGIVPIDAPRWVIYVGVGKPNKAGSIAAPAFSRIAARALAL